METQLYKHDVHSVADIKVGLEVVNNPSYHVARELEDHITWAQGSRIKEKVVDFGGIRDDFELMGN